MKKSVQMAALARACGVSVMTVSRAFRHSHSVDFETRRKILAAAARMG